MVKQKIYRASSDQILTLGKKFASLALAGYLLFLLGNAVYKNYLVKARISSLEKDVLFLRRENQRLNNLIAYYQTDTFRELEARSKLGLKKPEEIVFALPENSDVPPGEEETDKDKDSGHKPNYIKWWEYLAGSD